MFSSDALSSDAIHLRSGRESLAQRRLPIGAEIDSDGVSFRIWAPARDRAFLLLDGGGEHEMIREKSGYFFLHIKGLAAGARYAFHFGNSNDPLADPASRFQPEGPSGASMVVDPTGYQWNDGGWSGVDPRGVVLYEMQSAPSPRKAAGRRPVASCLS